MLDGFTPAVYQRDKLGKYLSLIRDKYHGLNINPSKLPNCWKKTKSIKDTRGCNKSWEFSRTTINLMTVILKYPQIHKEDVFLFKFYFAVIFFLQFLIIYNIFWLNFLSASQFKIIFHSIFILKYILWHQIFFFSSYMLSFILKKDCFRLFFSWLIT